MQRLGGNSQYEFGRIVLPSRRGRNLFGTIVFEKDGVAVPFPIRINFFSNKDFAADFLYRETVSADWKPLGSINSAAGSLLSPEKDFPQTSEFLIVNSGRKPIRFQGPVAIVTLSATGEWIPASTGDNAVIAPGCGAVIRLEGIRTNVSMIRVHFSGGDTLIAWGWIAQAYRYRYAAGIILAAGLFAALLVLCKRKKRRNEGR